MNSRDLRNKFCDEFEKKFKEKYRSDKYIVELSLLKKLISLYGEDVVWYAIEKFIQNVKKQHALILNFATLKYFEERFSDLLKLSKVLPFIKLRNIAGEYFNEVEELLEEYKLYTIEADIVYDNEKVRKREIIKRLKEIEEELCKKN